MNEQHIRQQFPALSRTHNGKPLIYLDGPGGTQVPQIVIDSISNYYMNCNANAHGQFVTTIETDHLIQNTRQKVADLLGAESASCISFGANMTTLNFALSKAIGRTLMPDDEIIITQLDHEANRGPWLALRSEGIKVREVRMKLDGTLDYDDFKQKINERTRLVAMGAASNILGTVNDMTLIRQWTHEVGAWLILDAVHYVPHFPVDVQALDCDFLLCSAYKFYGPHVGILHAKKGLLDRLPTDRLRTAYQFAPYSIETGTLNHAAIAGVDSAIDFIASISKAAAYRTSLVDAMQQIQAKEHQLFQRLYNGLAAHPKIQLYGLPGSSEHRTPTVSFTFEGKTPTQVCQHLAHCSICAWDGHFYALRAVEALGLRGAGGVTRFGLSIYSTAEEIDWVLEVLKKL